MIIIALMSATTLWVASLLSRLEFGILRKEVDTAVTTATETTGH
jgi:hypothetical protein